MQTSTLLTILATAAVATAAVAPRQSDSGVAHLSADSGCGAPVDIRLTGFGPGACVNFGGSFGSVNYTPDGEQYDSLLYAFSEPGCTSSTNSAGLLAGNQCYASSAIGAAGFQSGYLSRLP